MALGASIAACLLAMVSLGVVAFRYEPGSGGGGGGSAESTAGPVEVTMSEFAFSPSDLEVPAGGTLNVTNGGALVHNLEVRDTGIKTADLPGGESAELALEGLEPGAYEFFCNISGHAEQGMVGTLTVSGGAADGGGTASTGSGETTDHSAHDTDFAASDAAMVEGANAYVEAVVDSLEAGGPPSGVATEGRGNQPLDFERLPDGTKRFELTASIVDWEVEPGKVVEAWAYNGTVPGPWIRVEPGDKVQVEVTNELPMSTDIHWHGITTPFRSDGVAPITQPMIAQGENYTYEFTAPSNPELGMYHPHNHGNIAVVNGMWGVFQVGDVPLPRGRTINNIEIPADLVVSQEIPMVLNDAGTIGLSLNGKAFPATDPIVSRPGDWVLVHYYNEGLQAHPMHLHHMPQLVVARDGWPLESPYWADTVNVAPGERWSVLVRTTENDLDNSDPANPGPGIWAYHCHILTHAENDNGLFGMVTAWVVLPPT